MDVFLAIMFEGYRAWARCEADDEAHIPYTDPSEVAAYRKGVRLAQEDLNEVPLQDLVFSPLAWFFLCAAAEVEYHKHRAWLRGPISRLNVFDEMDYTREMAMERILEKVMEQTLMDRDRLERG